ncbi:hypothetical protein FACS1894202_01590 [Clostridia bacterium]|nr:hypothetical protein FACS1894202_01590 [Clostridia bacterium]
MADAIRTIIIMSITGGALTVLLLLVKPIIRNRLPKSAQYALWLVVLAALLIPVSKLVALPTAAPTVSEVVNQHVITSDEAFMNSLKITPENPKLTIDGGQQKIQQPTTISNSISLFVIIYPFGVLFFSLYHIVGYVRFARKLRRARVLTDVSAPVRVYRSSTAVTPMLIGLFRPSIILPDREYSAKQLESILAHELTHLRRKDVWIKWLSVLVGAVHWFNPLVYIARRELDRACELSCDEAVIRSFDESGRTEYGNTLLSVAAESRIPRAVVSTTMVESKQALKERLGAIMKSKKHTRAAIIVSAVLIIAAVGAVIALGAGNEANYTTTFIGTIEEIYDNSVLVSTEKIPGRIDFELADVDISRVIEPFGFNLIVGRQISVEFREVMETYPVRIRAIRIGMVDPLPAEFAATVYVWGEGERPTPTVEVIPATPYFRYAVYSGTPILTESDVYGSSEVFISTSDVTSALAKILDASQYFTIRFLQMNETDISKEEMSAIAESATRPFGDFSYAIGVFDVAEASTTDPDIIAAVEQSRPKISLYEYSDNHTGYNPSPDLNNIDGLKPITTANSGFAVLSDIVTVAATAPVGTVKTVIYWAESGTEQLGKSISEANYAKPLTEPRNTTGDFPVAEWFPNGFLGHIWAVTTDADGVEHTSEVVNAIYEPNGAIQPQAQLTAYLEKLFDEAYAPYYDGLRYEMSNYNEMIDGGEYTATFYWTMYNKNYFKDTETGEYKDADSWEPVDIDSDEKYSQENEGNFSFKATAKISGEGILDLSTVAVFGDTAVRGAPVYDAPLEGYFPSRSN